MTREGKQKAIDALKISVPVMAVTQEEFNDYIRTLNKVMDWLEQEPTTKNDLGVDCVARQDVERFIEGFINEYTPEEELEFINLELDGLKHLPRQHHKSQEKGRWIDKQHLCNYCSAECSSCHKRSNGYVHDNGFSLEHKYYDFCPNCGAKMESEG